MGPLSFVLLVRNVPYKRSGSGSCGGCGGDEGEAVSLRHEVCHRLLVKRFLSDTSYATEVRKCEDLCLRNDARCTPVPPSWGWCKRRPAGP